MRINLRVRQTEVYRRGMEGFKDLKHRTDVYRRIYCFAIILQYLQGFTKQTLQFMQIAGSPTIIYSVRILVAAIEREERCKHVLWMF